MVTDNSEIFRLDNLESVVGGTCGASDGGDISKNGSNQISNVYGGYLVGLPHNLLFYRNKGVKRAGA